MMEDEELKHEIVKAKDMNERSFQTLTKNFYIFRAAIRYFSVRQGLSFTSSKLSDRFPIAAASAGSGLTVLEQLDVLDSRTDSSKSRYMPRDVNIERLRAVEEILRESYEIDGFWQLENQQNE